MDSKNKWNIKYEEKLTSKEYPKPNERLVSLLPYLTGGEALDLACGLGANSVFLAKNRYKVKAVDISNVAIEHIRCLSAHEQLDIDAQVFDLTTIGALNLKPDSFDLVVNTYFLDRTVFPILKSIIRNGGYFFMETFFLNPITDNPISDKYKLRPNELLSEFRDWHVLYFEENEQEGRQTILVRKYVKV